jgi:hypothetical protein
MPFKRCCYVFHNLLRASAQLVLYGNRNTPIDNNEAQFARFNGFHLYVRKSDRPHFLYKIIWIFIVCLVGVGIRLVRRQKLLAALRALQTQDRNTGAPCSVGGSQDQFSLIVNTP